MVQRVTGRSKFDTEKALEWLDKHWVGGRICAVCQNNGWVVADELMEMRPFALSQEPKVNKSILLLAICGAPESHS